MTEKNTEKKNNSTHNAETNNEKVNSDLKDKSIVLENSSNKAKIGGFYFGFSKRLYLNIILCIIFAIASFVLFKYSLKVNNEKLIKYKEASNLDYKVYLLPNEFYDDKYLGKDMLYVASLIDKIVIDFDYDFSSDSKMNLDFTYNILADLVITNKTGTRSYYKKQYVLLKDQNLNMHDNYLQKISEKVTIDYPFYNSVANKFKSSFGVETESKLNIYMTVNKNSSSKDTYKINEKSSMNVVLPLSEKAVDIKINHDEINTSNSILQKKETLINNYVLFILSIVLFILTCVELIGIIRKVMLLKTKKTAFDKMVDKILKEYDRLIAESSTLISFKDKDVVKVKKFTELLDIHDNLQLPIIHYTITKHHKCYFYINHQNTVYLYVLKAVDLEVSDDAKKQ